MKKLDFKDIIEDFLNLSIYNPKFDREYKSVIDILVEIKSGRLESDINEEQAQYYIVKLQDARSTSTLPDILEPFNSYHNNFLTLRTDNFIFQETALVSFLEARDLCDKFVLHVDKSLRMGKHKIRNPYCRQFLNTTCVDMVKAFGSETNSEVGWVFNMTAQNTLITGLKTVTLVREDIKQNADLVFYYLLKDYKENKNNKFYNLRKLDLFEENYNSKKFDLFEVQLNLFYHFLTSIDAMDSYYATIRETLVADLRSQTISDNEYSLYNSTVVSLYRSYKNTKISTYDPLLLFQRLLNDNIESLEALDAFDEESIMNSAKFAHQFSRQFTNEKIENLIIAERIDAIYITRMSGLFSRSDIYKVMKRALDLLYKHSIIGTTQYLDYQKSLEGLL